MAAEGEKKKEPLRSPRTQLLLLEDNQVVQRPSKVLHSSRGHNDPVPPTPHIFGDPQKPTPVIFFQIEKESLPLNLDFFRTQCSFLSSLFHVFLPLFAQNPTPQRPAAQPKLPALSSFPPPYLSFGSKWKRNRFSPFFSSQPTPPR